MERQYDLVIVGAGPLWFKRKHYMVQGQDLKL